MAWRTRRKTTPDLVTWMPHERRAGPILRSEVMQNRGCGPTACNYPTTASYAQGTERSGNGRRKAQVAGNSLPEGPERQGAVAQHRIVEGADVEATAQASLRIGPEAPNLELADLVGQRLAGPDQVSVHLVGDVVHGERAVLGHELDRLGA